MPKWLQLNNGNSITIYDKPFASGGEGSLFSIQSGQDAGRIVVKIYNPDKRSQLREKKIEYLIKNPPLHLDSNGHPYIIWPKNIVYENGKFVGFTMPMASGEKLEFLCHPKLPKKLSSTWSRFSFSEDGIQKLRLKICYNIAVAIHHLHQNGNYVLTDLKPDNIIIQPTGLISIIDTDSVSVNAKDGTRFMGPVATPDYTPPEYYRGINPENQPIPLNWDMFSLSVLFYRLLCGIHPFSGTCKSPFDRYNSVHELIEKGLFPHSPSKGNYFHIVPPPHQSFLTLPQNIQKLFIQCFEEGHLYPEKRPTTNDWCQALSPLPIIISNRKSPIDDLHEIEFQPFHYQAISESELQLKSAILQSKLKNIQTNIDPNTSNKLNSGFNRLSLVENQLIQLVQKVSTEQQGFQLQFKNFFSQKISELSEYKSQLTQKSKQLNEEEVRKLQNLYAHRLMTTDLLEKKYIETIRTQLKPIHETFLPKQHAAEHQIQVLNAAYNDAILAKDNKLNQWLVAIENRVKKEEQKYFDKFEKEYNIQFKKLQTQKNKLNNEQKKELKLVENNFYSNAIYDQLSNFKIYDAAMHLFGGNYATVDNILMNLAYCGVVTAADFSLVNELNGSLLTKNGNWVRISGLNAGWAKQLSDWRTKLIRGMNTNIANIPLKSNDLEKVYKKYELKFYNIELEERKLWHQLQKQRNTIPTLLSRLNYLAKNKIIQLKKEHEKGIIVLNNKYYPKIQKCQLKLSNLQTAYQKKVETTKKKVNKQLKNSKLNDNVIKNFESEKNKIQIFYDVKQDEIRQAFVKKMEDSKKEILNFKTILDQKNNQLQLELKKYRPILERELELASNEIELLCYNLQKK